MLLLLLLLACCLQATAAYNDCSLSKEIRGRWYRQDRGIVDIGNASITDRGSCVSRVYNQHLFKRPTSPDQSACYICIVIWWNMHRNVLRIKETSKCHATADLLGACSHLYGDIPLVTLFRVDAEPEPCPLPAPASFSYRTPSGACDEGNSRLDACAMNTQMLLTYRPCALNNALTKAEEHVECLGSWHQSLLGKTTVHFIGRLLGQATPNEYRCFMYESSSSGGRLAISVDASCREMIDIDSATKRLDLNQIAYPSAKRQLQSALQQTDWLSLSTGLRHSFAGSTWRVHDPTKAYNRSRAIVTVRHEPLGRVHKYTVHVIDQCRHGYQCVKVYKRSSEIVELRRGALTAHEFEACDDDAAHVDAETIETLIAVDAEPRACPKAERGRYRVEGCEQAESRVVFGCEQHRLSITYTCQANRTHTYSCYGGWREDETQYLVVRDDDSQRWNCLMYSRSFEHLRLTAYEHSSCSRGLLLHSDQHRTMLATRTLRGSCDEPVSSSTRRASSSSTTRRQSTGAPASTALQLNGTVAQDTTDTATLGRCRSPAAIVAALLAWLLLTL